MNPRIVQVGKREWLAGLTWRSYEDKPSKDELENDAEVLGASWIALRVGEAVVQAGFSKVVGESDQPKKLASLAAMLADSRAQPWLGMFDLGEGLWWYVAVRDGHAILPDGDVIGTEEDVFSARERHSGFDDWNYVEGGVELLADLIEQVEKRPTKITSLIKQELPVRSIVVGVLVVLAILGGGYWYWQKKLNDAEEIRKARALTAAQLKADEERRSQVSVTHRSLISTPSPDVWLKACEDVFAQLPISRLGWGINGIECNGSNMVVNWSRNAGATIVDRPDGALAESGDSIVQTIPLTFNVPHGQDDAIPLGDAKLMMRAWAQTAGIALTMDGAAPVQVLPGTTSNQAPAISQATFSFGSTFNPFSLEFNDVPGVRLTTVDMDSKGWNIKGTIYGR